MYKKLPNSELFLVTNSSESILFAPLNEERYRIDEVSARSLRHATTINDIEDAELRSFIIHLIDMTPIINHAREESIEKTSKLSIIPNNICNLNCSYCYSASGRNQSAIDVGILESGLNWFIDKKRVGNTALSIFITGGGEPLATWQLTSKAIRYARQKAEEQGLTLYLSVITNGTLITQDKIDFLKSHQCKLGVSFDVSEELQNSNRGHYGKVASTMELLRNSGLRVMINTTITPLSVKHMDNIINDVIDKYLFIEQFTMEPVTAANLFKSAKELRDFYDTFFNSYISAKKKANNVGLKLRFTFDDALHGITKRHCPGKFVLTPSGKISVCHLVSSPKEERFTECTYGEVTKNGVSIDTQKFEELYNRNMFLYEKCNDCLAKWSCGGECMTRRATYPKRYIDEICNFNCKFIEHLIFQNNR